MCSMCKNTVPRINRQAAIIDPQAIPIALSINQKDTALARRMGIRTKEVNRFIRTVKNPGIDTVALVLRALGKRMTLQVA